MSLQQKAARQRLRVRVVLYASRAYCLGLVLLSSIGLGAVTHSSWAALVWGTISYVFLGINWDSLAPNKQSVDRVEHLNEVCHLMKYLVECLRELHTCGPSAMLLARISAALPKWNADDPYLDAAACAQRIAKTEFLLEDCRKVVDELPATYRAAIEAGCIDETTARVTYEFQKRREERPSAMENWLPGSFGGGLALSQNMFMKGDALVDRFGVDERDVRMTLGLFDEYRADIHRLGARAGLLADRRFAPGVRAA